MGIFPDHGEWPLTLTPREYNTAVRACYRHVQQAGVQTHTDIAWQLCNDDRNLEIDHESPQKEQLPYLKIVKPIDALGNEGESKAEGESKGFHEAAEEDESSDEPEVVEDEDDQMIEERHIRAKPRVQFEVHYHVGYNGPVLYFILLDFPEDKRNLDAVYEYVLLGDWKYTFTDVGVMGGLTYAEMPISGQPCFFIHPCLTGEALKEVTDGRKIYLEDYFQVWLGIVCAPVGIFLPIDESTSSRTSWL